MTRHILSIHDPRPIDADLWSAVVEFDRPVRNIEGVLTLRRHSRRVDLQLDFLGLTPDGHQAPKRGEPIRFLEVRWGTERDGIGAGDFVGEVGVRMNVR